MKKHKQNIDELRNGVKSILAKSGYSFSEEDRALLECILVEFEEISKNEKDFDLDIIKLISSLLKLLNFFGIKEVSDLF